MLLLEVLLTWAYFPDNRKPETSNECCSVQVLVTVRDGRVLGDVSGAGAGAALGCYWGCCFPVAAAYGCQGARAGAVWGIVVVASS